MHKHGAQKIDVSLTIEYVTIQWIQEWYFRGASGPVEVRRQLAIERAQAYVDLGVDAIDDD